MGDPNDAFKPHQFTDAALTTVIRSPDILRRVAERANLGISPSLLGATMGANPDENSELVNLVYSGPLKPPQAVKALTIYSEEIIKATQELQTREGQETAKFLAGKVEGGQRGH